MGRAEKVALRPGETAFSRVARDQDAYRHMRHVQDDARQRQVKDQIGNVRRPRPYVADASFLMPGRRRSQSFNATGLRCTSNASCWLPASSASSSLRSRAQGTRSSSSTDQGMTWFWLRAQP